MVSDIDTEDIRFLQYDQFPAGCLFFCQPNYNDHGHHKRRDGLLMADGDASAFINHDDWYEPDYIEKMMAAIDSGVDVAYCGWDSMNSGWGDSKPKFAKGSSTSGNFVFRTELGIKVGYNPYGYAADGEFIDKLAKETHRIKFVGEVLYHHNYRFPVEAVEKHGQPC